jgi:hypothetical protein
MGDERGLSGAGAAQRQGRRFANGARLALDLLLLLPLASARRSCSSPIEREKERERDREDIASWTELIEGPRLHKII